MNALQPQSRPPYPPQPRRRVAVRRVRKSQPHQAIATEASTKLVVNLLLMLITVSALFKLIPYNLAQQKSLKELQSKVTEVEGRVGNLQADFNHHFDPKQAMTVMQEQSTRVDPGQRQIIWLPPQTAQAPASTEEGAIGEQTVGQEPASGVISTETTPDNAPRAEFPSEYPAFSETPEQTSR
ncbi:MAG: hypothetical protein MUF49_05270 [Oculatellaceae cyanobacterium Prado106]|jgi:hypothetical protein|nr:hypothetical protein [Oculatellaceae cyanobacterium Prado106]